MNAPFTFADASAAAAILPRIDRREAEADFLHDLAARDASIRALLLALSQWCTMPRLS